MARAIDGDALLDEFKKEIAILKETPGKDDYDKGIIQGYKEAITHLKVSPTLTPPNEWVSVEDELPENNTQVLMWSARWKIAEAGSYYNQHFWVYSEIGDGYIVDNITHWIPVSSPPDKEQTT